MVGTVSTLVLALLTCSICTGSDITIISDSSNAGVDSIHILGSGSFVGNTNVEFTFVSSVDGYLKASSISYVGQSVIEDLMLGVEKMVETTLSHEEADRVSLSAGSGPEVKIITDIECPPGLPYAEEGGACLHFVVEVPLAINGGPEEFLTKDVLKSKFYTATNLQGALYDTVKEGNEATVFMGIGKPGAGEPL
ncbi:hypothetical protein ACHAWF_018069 [Thalassiosira exigua]